MRRFLLVLVVLGVLAGAGLAAAFVLAGPRIAEHAIRFGAERLGYRDVSLEVRRLTLRDIELGHFRAGPAPGLDSADVTVAWTPAHLLALRVASVDVGSATLHGVWNESGMEFPVLPPAEEEGPWLEPPVWDRVTLASARIELGGSEGPLTIRLRNVDLGAPPGARLRARGSATIERPEGRIDADADVVVDGDRVSGSAKVRSADGKLELVVDLGKSGPEPGVFPLIEALEQLELAGRVTVNAKAADLSPLTPSFTADGSIDFRLKDGQLRVRGDSLNVAGFGAIVRGLALGVELTQVSPPLSPPHQTLSVKKLDFGMDVGGGDLRFAIARGGVLEIESLAWRFQGGNLSARGRYDLDADANEIVVGVADVDLQSLVADLERDDLRMTGRLSGELPLRIEGDRIFAVGGRLTAGKEGGLIRYVAGGLPPPGVGPPPKEQPAGGSVGGVTLVLDALSNFQYRTLEIEVNGELTGDMILGLKIEGSNPDVYDGYPFQLNMNLEGPMAQVIRGSTTGFRIQDSIEERFQKRREGR